MIENIKQQVEISIYYQQGSIYLRLLFVVVLFIFFAVFDTPAGLEAFPCRVVCRSLCVLNNSGGGVREAASPVTCDLVFMRLVGAAAAAVRTFLRRRGELGLGEDSGAWLPGENALRGALEPRGVD